MKHDYPAVLRIAASHYRSLGNGELDPDDLEKAGEYHWIADRLFEAEGYLTELRRLIGCDHTDTTDGRLNLVRCVEQTLDGRSPRRK